MTQNTNQQPEDTSHLLHEWFRRARESQHVHYAAAAHFSRFHLLLGLPTIVLTTLVGTAVFASWGDEQSTVVPEILVGLISILASVLAALQTFLRFSDRAERHRATAAGYSSVRRRLEHLKTFANTGRQLAKHFDKVREQMDSLAAASPDVPRGLRERVLRELKPSLGSLIPPAKI